MATLRASIILEDRVSRVLDRINRNSARTERTFGSLERRLERLEATSEVTSRRFGANMDRMERKANASLETVHAGITRVETKLNAISTRRWNVNVNMDTGRASAQLAVIQAQINRIAGTHTSRIRVVQTGSTAATVGRSAVAGAVGGAVARGGGSSTVERVARPVASATGRAAAATGEIGGTVSANLGPIGLSGGKLAVGLMTLGPLIGTVATAAVGVLVPALGAVSAGMTSAGVATTAWGLGLVAVGVPVGLAIGRLKDLYKETDKARTALEKATPGTKTYTKALERYNDALAAGSPLEKAALKNYDKLAGSWNRLVTNGQSGVFALKLINSALAFANSMLPFVAEQMDRFTGAAAESFQTITRDAPGLKRVMSATFEPFPGYFKTINLGIYSMLKGLMGVARGAKPFTDFMVNGLGSMMDRFDKWANSIEGQQSMRRFFAEMIPVFRSLGDLIGATGKALVEIAGDPAMQRHTIDFINWLIVGIKALPGFIESMTDTASKLGPVMHDTFKTIGILIDDLNGPMVGILSHFNTLSERFNNLPAPARHALEAIMAFHIVGGMGKVSAGITGISAAVDVLTRGASRKARDIGKISGAMATFNAVQTSSALTGGVLAPVPGKGGGGIFSRFKKPPVTEGANGARAGASQIGKFTGPLGMAGTGAQASAIGLNGVRAGSGATAGASALGSAGAVGGGMGLAAGAAIVAALVVAVGAAYLSIKENFNGINEYISDTIGDIKGRFSGLGEVVSDFFNDMGLKNTGFVDTMSQLWEGIKPILQTIGNIIIVGIGESLETAIGLIGGLMRTLGGLINFLVGTFTGDWSQAWNGIKDIFGGAWDAITAVVSGVKDFIVGVVTDIAGLFGINIGRNDKKASSGGTAFTNAQTGQVEFGGFGQAMDNSAQAPYNPGMAPGQSGAPQGDGLMGWAGKAAGSAFSMLPMGGMLMNGVATLSDAGKAGAKKLDQSAQNKINSIMGAGGFKGLAGGGINWAYQQVKDKLGFDATMAKPSIDVGAIGRGDGSGLIPPLQALAAAMSAQFGVGISSGVRPGSITESGNLSLHASGNAVDLAGPAAGMQGVWQALLGNASISELIYNGMASYNGGPAVPYSGADKHTDHVHVGMGDGLVGRVPMRAGDGGDGRYGRVDVTVSMDGAHIEIKTGEDTKEWATKFAREVKKQLANLPHEDAEELAG